jgi:hypothetical protein
VKSRILAKKTGTSPFTMGYWEEGSGRAAMLLEPIENRARAFFCISSPTVAARVSEESVKHPAPHMGISTDS